jgi:5-methylcytosine-specific restriction endonuclease McrA
MRRMRHTRYRPARFANRRRREGWLPPALESRVQNVVTWVARLRRLAPVFALSQELVRFDTQLLANPEIDGVEYQQGELAGYEVRAYVLEKWGRACAYCHTSGLPLELDPIVPQTRPDGSDRVSNLAPACRSCNETKGHRTAADFGHPEVQARAQQPLKDAAAVNATRWALHRRLVATNLPVAVGTGGRTKWNRTRRGLLKAHWTDAACVGASTPEALRVGGVVPLASTAMGRHSRQMRRTDAHGFPDKAPKATSVVGGFRTGASAREISSARWYLLQARRWGCTWGGSPIAVRATGSCTIKTATGTVQGIHYRYCRPLHRGDGNAYQRGEAALRSQA